MAAFPTLEEAFAAAERDAQEKRANARAQARNAAVALQPGKLVSVRVLKLGHDKISMGVHVGGVGEAYYERGDVFDLDEAIATALEDKGFVEIQGEAVPELPQKTKA